MIAFKLDCFPRSVNILSLNSNTPINILIAKLDFCFFNIAVSVPDPYIRSFVSPFYTICLSLTGDLATSQFSLEKLEYPGCFPMALIKSN